MTTRLEELLQDGMKAQELGHRLARVFQLDQLTKNMYWFNGGPRDAAEISRFLAKLLAEFDPQP